MPLDVVTGFLILALIAWVVGVLTFRVVRRMRYGRPVPIPGKPPARLMSPIEWTSVGLALALWGLQGFMPRTPPRPQPAPNPTPAQPATKGSAAEPPANAPGNAPAANAPRNKPPANAPAISATEAAAHGRYSAPTADVAAEEKRWCNQGDRMMVIGQYSMAAQAYWEALRVQPASERGRAGLIRARRAISEELARQRETAFEASVPDYGSAGLADSAPGRTEASGHSEAAHAGGSEWSRRQDSRFHQEQGDRLLAQGMAHAAIAEYQKAVESDPSNVQAREGLDKARRQAAAARTPAR